MTPLSRELCNRSCKLHHLKRSWRENDLLHSSLDNGVMITPKRRLLSFVFAVICLSKSLLIRTKNKRRKIMGVTRSVASRYVTAA